ncbi:MAG: tRNA 2-thiocytidine biosynthesis protein TtcA [Clostridiales bacterium]|jgi:tRNA(Ile)-lysidine synthase TilS/MesJ|nr:tRNA 2-thiocytidine biosynthesis protein TtcA [Clostridiales bacterium]
MEKFEAVEQSIIKKYRKDIWRGFIRGIQEYELVREGDQIAACLSGGKDSMLMAKCLQELQKYSHTRFNLVFLVMDPGYSPENRRIIEENARLLRVPALFFDTGIYDAVAKVGAGACYLCARMRRGYLYRKAQELGCNKIALGHHYDDAVETILLSMFYSGEFKTMMPKLKSRNCEGMELIRPLYLVREDAVIAWRDYHRLRFIRCACRFSENPDICGGGSKRAEIKAFLRQLRKTDPVIEKNIFRSVENVHVDAVIGCREKNIRRHFLDSYDAQT